MWKGSVPSEGLMADSYYVAELGSGTRMWSEPTDSWSRECPAAEDKAFDHFLWPR